MMKRRAFITLLGGAAAMWPLAARAQPARTMGRIGVLGPSLSNPFASTLYQAFLAQLRELGFNEGQNLVAEYQAMDDARGPFVATIELMRSQPDLVVALGPEVALQAVVGASGSVPIVFIAVNYDPIARGYVTSVALIRDPSVPAGSGGLAAIQTVAPSLGVELTPVGVRDAGEIERAIAAFARSSNGGLILVGPTSSVRRHFDLVVALAARHRLPAVYPNRLFVTGGGLISYAPDSVDQYRRAAGYVDRILKGEKPADLPVQAPTKYELVINLKTAKALGLTVPDNLLARADEVIE